MTDTTRAASRPEFPVAKLYDALWLLNDIRRFVDDQLLPIIAAAAIEAEALR